MPILFLKDNNLIWRSHQCPHCKNDILISSDVWKHENKLCTSGKEVKLNGNNGGYKIDTDSFISSGNDKEIYS